MIDLLYAYPQFFFWVSLFSLGLFLGSLALVPFLVARIPEAYFLDLGKRPRPVSPGRLLALILKNGLGAVLVLAGIVMLFIPGQGLLTMVAGLFIMEFPGKKKVIAKAVQSQKIQQGLNWVRKKKGRPPLKF